MRLTNNHNLPTPLVNAICSDDYDGTNDLFKKKITATTLINPPKISILTDRNKNHPDYTEDVSDRIWILLGQAIHAVLDRTKDDPEIILKERRFEREFLDWTITGKPDLLYGTELWDYKVTSAWTLSFNPMGRSDWEPQLNIYRWLLNEHGHKVENLKNLCILRDWSEKEMVKAEKRNLPYPERNVVALDIPMWDLDRVERFIEEKLYILDYLLTLDSDLIVACDPEDRWKNDMRCRKYCSVKQFCHYGRGLK